MTFRGQVIPILPKRGLNTGDNPFNIPEEQSPDCLNVRFGEKSVEKRDGISRYIATAVQANPVVGIGQLILSSGTTHQLVAAGSELARENAGAWSSIKGALTLTSGQNNHVQMAQLTDIMVGTNNVDSPWTFNGTGNAAALTGWPASILFKAVTDFKNYLMVLNTSESGTRRKGRLRYSALNNIASSVAANFNDLLNNSGQEGVGFGKTNDQLFAFFDASIQEVIYTGDATTPFRLFTVSPEVGSVSGYAIVVVDDVTFFPSYLGIYAMRGGIPDLISKDITGTWATVNKNRLGQIQGAHNPLKNEVWFSVSTGSSTTNDKVLVHNYVTKEWTVFDSWNVNAFGRFRSTLPTTPILGNYSGIVFQSNTGTYLDDTSAIIGYVRTKVLPMGDAGRKCQVKRLQIVMDSETQTGARLKVSHAYGLTSLSNQNLLDVTAGGALWDAATWGVDVWADVGTREIFYRPDGHGRLVQFEFRNDQASTGMGLAEVYAWTRQEAA